MAEEIKTSEGPSDQPVSNDAAEREEGNAYLKRGKEFIRRNKGRVALAAAGLIALGVAWKLGYFKEAVDAAKSVWNSSEQPSQPRISANAIVPASNPAVVSPQAGARATPNKPFSVGSHVRNLHEGWTNSPENRALAAKNGVSLKPNQSYIPTYEKYRDAA